MHKVPCKIEVSLPRTKKSDLIFPPSIVNGIAVSKTFQILYRNEEVQLDDVIHYRIHIVLDSAKIEETLRAAEFSLEVGSVCVSVSVLKPAAAMLPVAGGAVVQRGQFGHGAAFLHTAGQQNQQ